MDTENLKNFRVNLFIKDSNKGIDLTQNVLDIKIEESINSSLKGTITYEDGLGLSDITGFDTDRITVEFNYLGSKVGETFYTDGLNHINMTESGHKKTFIINLKAIKDVKDSMQLLAKSFSGKATEIIEKIHTEAFGPDSLIVNDTSLNRGKYIAPNISPNTAINSIKNNSYNNDITPFFIFQKLMSPDGVSYLESLKNIMDKEVRHFLKQEVNTKSFKTLIDKVGDVESIIIEADHTNNIKKIRQGQLGKKVIQYDVSGSNLDQEVIGETDNAISLMSPFRKDMYNHDEEPLLNGGDYINKCISDTKKLDLFSTIVNIMNCEPIPNLGVGDKVHVDVPIKNPLMNGKSSKHSADYMVLNVIHSIIDGSYKQNMKLGRGK